MEKKEKKFEEKMSELEVLVKSLENGDIALDDAIKSFTEAMNLAKDCDKELKDAEKALTEIVSEDGTLKEFKGEPIMQPTVGIEKADETGVIYVFTFTTKPEIKINKYTNLGVKKDSVKVTKKDVDNEIEKMR